ncbi:MAG: hypothetical protein CL489_05930 [Acidobacteria bacterium]|uniref:Uncharacterized protein n=1 Tax=marine metagenome TaxID=408172 RepID=A0A382MUB8_9ZZZZ|nr:hypothetical protein [Acidobacteriota bacterium]
MKPVYEDDNQVRKIVEIGRNLVTLCEENLLYAKNDLMWNAAVTAGNKLVTVGMTWTRFTSLADLNKNETKALYKYLTKKDYYDNKQRRHQANKAKA